MYLAFMTAMIEIEKISKSFGSSQILKDISLSIDKGEVLALIGFSGSGKSTILKLVAELEKLDKGYIKLGSKKLGMCFQYSALFDSLTVEENVGFPLKYDDSYKHLSKAQIKKMVSEKLKLVGLAGTENAYPSELSGGMKKRVSFARGIITDPEIILYDEPTAGLDPVASTIIEDLIVKIQEKTHAASIVVTHQPSTIKRTATRVAMVYDKKIAWEGSPEELFNPKSKNEYCIQFRDGTVDGPMKVKF